MRLMLACFVQVSVCECNFSINVMLQTPRSQGNVLKAL
jgi:hypothetical protein